jgi:hypothetical protein
MFDGYLRKERGLSSARSTIGVGTPKRFWAGSAHWDTRIEERDSNRSMRLLP